MWSLQCIYDFIPAKWRLVILVGGQVELSIPSPKIQPGPSNDFLLPPYRPSHGLLTPQVAKTRTVAQDSGLHFLLKHADIFQWGLLIVLSTIWGFNIFTKQLHCLGCHSKLVQSLPLNRKYKFPTFDTPSSPLRFDVNWTAWYGWLPGCFNCIVVQGYLL